MIATISSNDITINLNETNKTSATIQRIKLLLGTIKGTCPFDRDFGISSESIDKPINIAKVMLFADIKEAIEKYEKDVTVLGISFDESISGKLIPTVEVEIYEE